LWTGNSGLFDTVFPDPSPCQTRLLTEAFPSRVEKLILFKHPTRLLVRYLLSLKSVDFLAAKAVKLDALRWKPMTTLLILYVTAADAGQILLNANVVKGVLRSDMKGNIEGRTIEIKGIKAVRGTETGFVRVEQQPKEAKEGQAVVFLVTGAEQSLFEKYKGRPVEFR
jgi:hypothetical protein